MTELYQYQGQELELFEEARQWKKYLASEIKPFIRGRVLEVGAGISETTAYLFNTGVTSWMCLEPDEQLHRITANKIAQQRLPVNCEARWGTLENLKPEEMFDTIVYIDVLEHIENDRKEVILAAAHLKPGGYLVILSPAYQWLYNPFDKAVGHFRRYTRKSLRNVVHPSGLCEKKLFYLESWGIGLLVLNKILFRKKYPTKAVVRFWDRVFIPLSKISDRVLSYSIGKSIIGVWERQKA